MSSRPTNPARKGSLSSAAVAAALSCLPALGAPTVFVSSGGNDASQRSGCTLRNPCRSFHAAHGAVDPGGEIVALDTADYGRVTITKSVSILGNPGIIAGITVPALKGIDIETPGVNVVLRDLTINGIGDGQPTFHNMTRGVSMSAGSSLSIENCVISNLFIGIEASAGEVRIINSLVRASGLHGAIISGDASADVVNSRFMGNGDTGLVVSSISPGTASASISDSVASGNWFGFASRSASGAARVSLIRSTAANNVGAGFLNEAEGAAGSAVMTVGASMASGNGTGFFNAATGGAIATFESLGNNIVRHNTSNSSGAITAVPAL